MAATAEEEIATETPATVIPAILSAIAVLIEAATARLNATIATDSVTSPKTAPNQRTGENATRVGNWDTKLLIAQMRERAQALAEECAAAPEAAADRLLDADILALRDAAPRAPARDLLVAVILGLVPGLLAAALPVATRQFDQTRERENSMKEEKRRLRAPIMQARRRHKKQRPVSQRTRRMVNTNPTLLSQPFSSSFCSLSAPPLCSSCLFRPLPSFNFSHPGVASLLSN